jgi:hypothetical protein
VLRWWGKRVEVRNYDGGGEMLELVGAQPWTGAECDGEVFPLSTVFGWWPCSRDGMD